MNKQKIIVLALLYSTGILSILGSGETTSTLQYWGKDGVTYEDARSAHAGCKFDVGMQKFETIAEKRELIEACMEKQGFRQTLYYE